MDTNSRSRNHRPEPSPAFEHGRDGHHCQRLPVYLRPSQLLGAADSNAIRPFRFHVPEEQLSDLRRRINAMRWPDQETVDDGSQGVQLATFQEISRAIGAPSTTGGRWRRGSMRCRCSSPRSMASIFISSMFVRSTTMPCR